MTRWVVVGAGSAGCVVASRLSAHPDNEVVLLEAGDAEPLQESSNSVFDALATPGRVFTDLDAIRVEGRPAAPYRRGRGLGGSSSVNAMLAPLDDTIEGEHLIPLEVAQPAELGAVDRALLAAAPDAEAVPLTRRAGRRVSSADAYLIPHRDRASLYVHGGAWVDRVLLEGRTAVGVRLADGREVMADRVVLSAGAIHSPAILLRSEVATPGVGIGLRDHPSAPIALDLRPEARVDPSALAVATLLRRGPLQVMPMNHLGRDAPGYGLLMPALMRSRSSGVIRLRDRDPMTHPEVRFGMLAHPDDVEGLIAAVRIAIELLRSAPFTAIVDGAYIDEHGTSVETLGDERMLRRWLPDHVGDYVHAGCSCAMGTVVDEDGWVIGYEGLAVCDASVFPELPELNLHLPTVLLAERLAARWARHA